MKYLLFTALLFAAQIKTFAQNKTTTDLINALGDDDYYVRTNSKNILKLKGKSIYLPLKIATKNSDIEVAELAKEVLRSIVVYSSKGFNGEFLPIDKDIKTMAHFKQRYNKQVIFEFLSEYEKYGAHNVNWNSSINKLIKLSYKTGSSTDQNNFPIKDVTSFLIEKECDDIIAYYLISKFFFEEDNHEQARATIKKALKKIPAYKGSKIIAFNIYHLAAKIFKEAYQFQEARQYSALSMTSLSSYFTKIITGDRRSYHNDRIYFSYVNRIYHDNSKSDKLILFKSLHAKTNLQKDSLYLMIRGRHQYERAKEVLRKRDKNARQQYLQQINVAIHTLTTSIHLNPHQPEVAALIIHLYGIDARVAEARYWFDYGINIEFDNENVYKQFIELILHFGNKEDQKAFSIEGQIAGKKEPRIKKILNKYFYKKDDGS